MTVYPHDLNADLHAHSIRSDGTLTPQALVERASERGVELFALTDHDEVSGIAEARRCAQARGLRFVAGVEVSVTFAGHTVHVVCLGIDEADEPLLSGLARVRAGRTQRAHEMAAGLAAAGIPDAYAGALQYVGNPDLISRTHFARYLVQIGICSDSREVFGRYLTEGKPGYVPHRWASLKDAVQWIRGAGGVPIIAHPARYRLSPTELWALVSEFREAGGVALEVATSSHSADDIRRFAQLALEFGLEGSRGSDFHGPGESHAELGVVAPVPYEVTPVWHRFC
jgi:predicted metal-dependent phosphoesterase TrpH